MDNDSALICRARAGDEGAFVDLIRAYHSFVYAIVIDMVNNPQDAEEIVQDTFLNVYRGLAQYEERSKFKTWLAEIARNRARSWLRKQRIDTVPIDELSLFDEIGKSTVKTQELPDEQLILSEQRELIRRALGTLSPKEREIVHSYYLDGADYDELMSTHGLSYKAISVRLSRAKQKLAKRLEHLLSGVFVSPITSLKNFYSGGLTVMKVGTVAKITAGAVAIIVLAFIGTRQFISSKEDNSPTVEIVTSTESANLASQTDATRKGTFAAPSREGKPQISAEEMGQIEDFFAQLEGADAQSEADSPQLATDEASNQDSELGDTDSPVVAEDTDLSAEEVMNAYVKGFQNLDFEAVHSLSTGRIKGEWAMAATGNFPILDPAELAKLLDRLKDLSDLPVEMRQMAEQQMRSIEQEIRSGAFERKMRNVWLKSLSQLDVVRNEYVGDEFHFVLGGPAPDKSEITWIEISDVIVPNTLFKMRKGNGAWRVYESEILDSRESVSD